MCEEDNVIEIIEDVEPTESDIETEVVTISTKRTLKELLLLGECDE